MKYVLASALLVGALGTGCAHSAPDPLEQVHNTYLWFNNISSPMRESFTENDVAQYFAPEAKMITNGKLVCTGIKEHTEHFHELNRHYQWLKVNINDMRMWSLGQTVFLDYGIDVQNHEGQLETILVMGYMELEHGKIINFKEVIQKERKGLT